MTSITTILFFTIIAVFIFPGNSSIIMHDQESNKNEVAAYFNTELKRLGTKLFGTEDPAVGERVKLFDAKKNTQNPEEMGSYVEGDLLIPTKIGRSGLVDITTRWPDGVVPYVIEGTFTAAETANFEKALVAYHTKTCIRFKPYTTETDYIAITSQNTGCFSAVGRIGGRQVVNLQSPGCMSTTGTPIHELMHALGFVHEQSRYERDSYVRIATENIITANVDNFEKVSQKLAIGFGIDYDYGSVMHYSPYAFTSNGQPTIAILKPFMARSVGQRNGFSPFDIQKINIMYGCKLNTKK